MDVMDVDQQSINAHGLISQGIFNKHMMNNLRAYP